MHKPAGLLLLALAALALGLAPSPAGESAAGASAPASARGGTDLGHQAEREEARILRRR